MYLKKLELQGFKSFAAPTTLEFQRGISAIVGPNGSGKSNIADALRFVLGEQSMKSIRSKKGEDLIFSGSPAKSRMNMGSVALTFDNEDKTFPVEFDTVKVMRKIFRDGENQYSINDAHVRLKDLAELIAKAKLGLKGYTIINQGMGDAILDASPKERKEIIFEALGLKEFQMKRAEALLKLSHTQVNLEKAEGIVREIEPHLKFLKRQVEKMEERHTVEEKLKQLEVAYVVKRLRVLEGKLRDLKKTASGQETRIIDLRLFVETKSRELENAENEMAQSFTGSSDLDDALMKEETARNAVERELGKIEGMIAAIRRQNTTQMVAVDVAFVRNGLEKLDQLLEETMKEATHEGVRAKLELFSRSFAELFVNVKEGKATTKRESDDGVAQFESEQKRLSDALRSSDERLRDIKEKIKQTHGQYNDKKEAIFELKNARREKELELRRLEDDARTLEREVGHVQTEADVLQKEKMFLESKGAEFFADDSELPLSADEEEMRKNIERIKIRLENIDLIDENVGKEFQETQKRYDFLTTESQDLRLAIASIETVVGELDDVIAARFQDAFKKINENFNAYFRLLFEGGSARLDIVKEEQNVEEGVPTEGERTRASDGVEIDVSLPRKKTTGLSVLSGGERALTSLALLFALVSTSPPPFLVLDEIDAPLDEGNSVRFSKILVELKDRTQFVVITHNRETMRQADILWGITMQEDGISKLLSLKFEAAKELAR